MKERFMKNGVFSLEYDKETLKDMVLELQEEIEILNENAKNNDKVVDNVNWENQLLKKENQELKEQLEDMTLCRDIASGHRQEVQDREVILLTQQKEFIKYLEDEIKELQEIKETELDYDILKDVIPELLVFKDVLQKYKEIIGDVKIMITNRIYEKLNNNIDVDFEEYYFSNLELENERLKRKVKKLKRKIRKLKNKNYDKQDVFVIYLQMEEEK